MDTALWSRALREVEPIDRRERRAITRAVVAVAAAVGLAVALYLSGLTRPGISFTGSASGSSTAGSQTARADLDIVNRGIFTERDVSVQIDYPGVTITSARLEPEPLTPWSSGTLRIDLEVDCTAPPPVDMPDATTAWTVDEYPRVPLVISTDRPWGLATMESIFEGQTVLHAASMACETP